MNLGKINLVTPPDNLFNSNVGYLLVKPNTKIKVQFQTILSAIDEDINVYVYDEDEVDIAWMLNVSNQADIIIIDIDNCDPITINFISLLLTNPKCFYLTEDETIPWGLISKNRIYNLDFIVDQINQSLEEDDDDEDDKGQ